MWILGIIRRPVTTYDESMGTIAPELFTLHALVESDRITQLLSHARSPSLALSPSLFIFRAVNHVQSPKVRSRHQMGDGLLQQRERVQYMCACFSLSAEELQQAIQEALAPRAYRDVS
ncbi:hypothetical protein TgHK011_008472 [Trichoderma gracile]|nr:hypothetical protein TgHK011_008472 [Trichoderma gracile]